MLAGQTKNGQQERTHRSSGRFARGSRPNRGNSLPDVGSIVYGGIPVKVGSKFYLAGGTIGGGIGGEESRGQRQPRGAAPSPPLAAGGGGWWVGFDPEGKKSREATDGGKEAA